MKNKLYLIVGPSGVGKNTLLENILATVPKTFPAVSVTTRDPRPGEQEGVHYYYRSTEDFISFINQDMLLQYVSYSGNYYGLLKGEINNKLAQGDAFAVVEPEGVKQLQEIYPEALSLFLRPTDGQELVDRMKARGDSEESIVKRMETYNHFMDYLHMADFTLAPGNPAEVLAEATHIIKAHRNE
jgi:guanylate kinase